MATKPDRPVFEPEIPDELDLEDMNIGRLLAVAGSALSDRWRKATDKHELGMGGSLLLFALAQNDGLSHREAARQVWLSPASVSGIADRLETDNLVERVRDPGDRRVVRLHLTEKGRAEVARAGEIVAAEMGPLFPSVTPEDEAIVRRYLIDIVRNIIPRGEST